MKNEPRVNKSKAEILDGMKKNAEFQKKLAFTKEKFYPALCKASANIEDAGLILAGFNTQIMQSFLEKMKDVKLNELNLQLKLDVKADNYLEFQDLLALFQEMSVFEAKDLIEGMRGELELFKTEEWKARPLESLKVTWIDEYVAKNNANTK